jgi:hypothetical protein
MTGRLRRSLAALVAVAAAAALSSCVEVPRTGPVVRAQTDDQNGQPGPVYNPPPPASGAQPADVVAGFLEAMTATPLRPGPAKQFLTTQAAGEWHPRQVLVFRGHTPPFGQHSVEVDLRGADLIGVSGRWQGRAPRADSKITFPMTHENGEWRIARAPNAWILQRDFYEQNYTSQDTSQSTSLYFFDPTGRLLVPEPVHVPQGSQLATALVKGLLRGAPSSPNGVERSYFPPRLTVSLSVPVDRNVADVSLNGPDPGPLTQQTTQRMLGQLAWTLRQDASIRMFTLTVANRVVTDAAGSSHFAVDAPEFDRYDPAGWKANSLTYALRRGSVVSGQVTRLTPVLGPFGSERLGISRFAVSLDNNRIAAVAPTGLRVGIDGGQPTTVLSGSDLLRPAWDARGRLWEIQNVPGSGAQVFCIAGRHQDRLTVPGITGEDVRRFLVSRDGSRLIAVVRGPHRDRIMVTRLRYDGDGVVDGASRAHRIAWHSRGTSRIRDIGWTSPTTIAVLDRLSGTLAEVRILTVDGSTRPGQVSPILVRGDVRYLATSPGQQTPYAVQRPSVLFNLSPAEATRAQSIDGVHQLTYAG